jgi:hypothetical protein
MRINEFDNTHKEFKKIILDHNITEEQLDEILPAIVAGLAGAGKVAAKIIPAAVKGVGAVAKGIGAVARGVAGAASTAARAVGSVASTGARAVGSAANTATTAIGGIGTQGGNTIGQTSSQPNQKTQFQRGQTFTMPTMDKKQANFTVSNTMGDEVELKNPQPKPGEPTAFKFKKKDLDKFIQPQ